MKQSRRDFIKMTGAGAVGLGAMSLLLGCHSSDSSNNSTSAPSQRIAILSDVHFHDVYGDYDLRIWRRPMPKGAR